MLPNYLEDPHSLNDVSFIEWLNTKCIANNNIINKSDLTRL